MTGPKLNEGATIAGERAGTKASARYVRSSASKARVVLDLIRGLDVRRADEVLHFTERGIAKDVRKVLASAVANAVHNDEQDADELFVLACFADEGPTLKRFRPRARGRATRVRKRTCHITVVVARMSDERIAVVQSRQAGARGARPTTTAASRRARVERSRQRAQQAAGTMAADAATADAEPTPSDDDVVDSTAELADEIEAEIDAIEAEEAAEDAAAEDAAADAEEDEETMAEDISDEVTGGEGSASDEPHASRAESEADGEGAIEEASDEPQASRAESEADGEGAI
jgi:large subunit ribosomal protein L22